MALPVLRCPINPKKSHDEVKRIVRDKTALMAMIDGELVGSMGLIDAVWWYGDVAFLTDRWHFCFPVLQHGAVNKALIDEAKKIAADAGLDFIHQGKIRPARNGITMMMPRLYEGSH